MRVERQKSRRRTKVVVLTAGLVLVGGAAFAWWTAGGSGTGSATTGTVEGITIKQTTTIADLYPGQAPVALAGNFDNGNDGPVRVAQVTVAIQTGWSAQADSGKPACTAADFTLTQPDPQPAGSQVPAGNGVGSWGGATIQLNNLPSNQDNCKNVTVPLVYSSN